MTLRKLREILLRPRTAASQCIHLVSLCEVQRCSDCEQLRHFLQAKERRRIRTSLAGGQCTLSLADVEKEENNLKQRLFHLEQTDDHTRASILTNKLIPL